MVSYCGNLCRVGGNLCGVVFVKICVVQVETYVSCRWEPMCRVGVVLWKSGSCRGKLCRVGGNLCRVMVIWSCSFVVSCACSSNCSPAYPTRRYRKTERPEQDAEDVADQTLSS